MMHNMSDKCCLVSIIIPDAEIPYIAFVEEQDVIGRGYVKTQRVRSHVVSGYCCCGCQSRR